MTMPQKLFLFTPCLFVSLVLPQLARAEYTKIQATCLYKDAGGTDHKADVRFTFLSRIGTPRDPHPRQVRYTFSMDANNSRTPRLNALRSTPDLDSKTSDGFFKTIVLTAASQENLRLDLNLNADGTAADSAIGSFRPDDQSTQPMTMPCELQDRDLFKR